MWHDVIAWPARVKPPAGPQWNVTDDDRRWRQTTYGGEGGRVEEGGGQGRRVREGRDGEGRESRDGEEACIAPVYQRLQCKDFNNTLHCSTATWVNCKFRKHTLRVVWWCSDYGIRFAIMWTRHCCSGKVVHTKSIVWYWLKGAEFRLKYNVCISMHLVHTGLCPSYLAKTLLSTAITHTVFPLIEAGSQIEAGGGESKGEYHTANCTSPGSTVVHCVFRAYCVISRTAVWHPKKKQSSNGSRVSNRSRGGRKLLF